MRTRGAPSITWSWARSAPPRSWRWCLFCWCGGKCCELVPHHFEEPRHRPDAQVIIFDLVLLVGRVQAIVREAEPHQHGRNPQMRREIAHDRNRSAGTNEHRVAPEDLAESARRGGNRRMVGID